MFGLPEKYRGSIWKLLSKSINIAMNHEKKFYLKLLEVKNKEIENTINRDIERTFLNSSLNKEEENIEKKSELVEKEEINKQEENLFLINKEKLLMKKRNQLFKILKAYSVYDPQVGYTQGTNFIVMLILSCVKSSEEAFWIFVQIMHDKNWRLMFINNTPKLMKSLDNLIIEIKKRIPDLYEHLKNQNVI